MKLRNVRIGVRLGIGFGVILTILVLVIVANNALGDSSRMRLITGLEAANGKVLLATKMKTVILESGLAMRNIGLQSDVEAMQKEVDKISLREKEYVAARNALADTGLTTDEGVLLENIAQIKKDMETPIKEAIGHALAFNSEGAAKVISHRIDPITQKALIEIDKLVLAQRTAAELVLVGVIAKADRAMYVFYLIALITVTVGGLFVWFLARSITLPLKEAVDIATSVASGELVSNVQVNGNDEISKLLAALKEMNANLIKIVGEVRSGTDTISHASCEIVSENENLSSRTQSQSKFLESTAAAMEELTATVKQNADSSEQAHALVISFSRSAKEGAVVVSQVVDTMQTIQESSRKIVDIISVIDSIAFQTNILALNAAVEAARAGNHGRGFAVVASEVRSLAQRSASAAKDIKILINNSVQKISDGSQLADKAGLIMTKILNSVEKVSMIFDEIIDASREQSIGIQEVNQAISRMDEMTHLNAGMVEQAAAAAQCMRDEASVLLQSVSAFKWDEENFPEDPAHDAEIYHDEIAANNTVLAVQ